VKRRGNLAFAISFGSSSKGVSSPLRLKDEILRFAQNDKEGKDCRMTKREMLKRSRNKSGTKGLPA